MDSPQTQIDLREALRESAGQKDFIGAAFLAGGAAGLATGFLLLILDADSSSTRVVTPAVQGGQAGIVVHF